mgnify:CR=1 FL=1
MRFAWGSFLFNGLVDGIEETIDFFSPEGKPLRASISLTLSQQTILVSSFSGSGRIPGRPKAPGTSPMTPAALGSTLQGLAGAAVPADAGDMPDDFIEEDEGPDSVDELLDEEE